MLFQPNVFKFFLGCFTLSYFRLFHLKIFLTIFGYSKLGCYTLVTTQNLQNNKIHRL
jgi:hypothetical protein